MLEILILVSLYGIYQIVIEIRAQRKCPEDRILKNVVLGIEKRDSAIADRVIRHLGVCQKCRDKAKEIGSE